ncbi:hypothetical protein ACPOL_0396 [Acidisarcina polymorpha]|uniref:Uncharacterized protein n=1 Tax=Acidisarcina polymorpha TaxID=2211140 RepID=A0A2Z5FTK9_9BACT|nr:hypothetical protein [Acidisarcina polymorpha]AXC09775.1 hypothetical protein ACPOL_0396 [Acidisarcina polymorpha]
MRKFFKLKTEALDWVVLAGLVMISALCNAEEGHCAWLNEATASGVLNGSVTLTLESAPDDQTICTFTNSKTAKDYSALRIMVQPLKDVNNSIVSHKSLCTSTPTALKAIGNEAVSCSADVGYSRGEQVIGRVRDRLFIVAISSTMAHDPLMARPALKEKAKLIAEQVSGALF